uniref:Peptidyl-tRNA hydrolase n=1 Tax=Rhizophora mucronata TaxID=61149 RepID=A0A2P2L5M1_RHIMU
MFYLTFAHHKIIDFIPDLSCMFNIGKVGPLAAHYQVPLRHILLVYDEMSLPSGVLRLQPKGGHGHHNGYALIPSSEFHNCQVFYLSA